MVDMGCIGAAKAMKMGKKFKIRMAMWFKEKREELPITDIAIFEV